ASELASQSPYRPLPVLKIASRFWLRSCAFNEQEELRHAAQSAYCRRDARVRHDYGQGLQEHRRDRGAPTLADQCSHRPERIREVELHRRLLIPPCVARGP